MIGGLVEAASRGDESEVARPDSRSEAQTQSADELVPQRCFAAGTLIAAESGDRPIEAVRVGDLVWAFNEETGDVGLYPVVETFSDRSDHRIEIEVGGQVILTTERHPFWVQGKGWIEAGSISAGDALQSLDEDVPNIESVRRVDEETAVYNIEVETAHSFYVSSLRILVHNKSDTPRTGDMTVKERREHFKQQGYGDNELGPSGYPKRHFVEHSSRKKALEASGQPSGTDSELHKRRTGRGQRRHFHDVRDRRTHHTYGRRKTHR
jgi:hypothetical protein